MMPTPSSYMRAPIEAVLISDEDRLGVLPTYFGGYASLVEACIHSLIGAMAPSFRGSYWHFFELSNGGFYMAPDLPWVHLRLSDGYEIDLTSDATGIAVCLIVFSQLARYGRDRMFKARYDALQDFACVHKDWASIRRVVYGALPSAEAAPPSSSLVRAADIRSAVILPAQPPTRETPGG